MSYPSAQRMRKAAILVTSLDQQCARQIRAGLSPSDSATLEQAIAGLGLIDSEERSDVLHEFRMSTATAAHGSIGVEVDWSTTDGTSPDNPPDHGQADIPDRRSNRAGLEDSGEDSEDSSQPIEREPSNEIDAFEFLHEAKPNMVAELLAGEHPQTSAAVLAQLPATLVSQLLSAMSTSCQVDILERLADPHPADPQAIQIIQSHLADWLEKHRQQAARLSHGSEMVRQILSHTTGSHRRKLLSQLGKQGSRLVDLTTPYPSGNPWPNRLAEDGSYRNIQPRPDSTHLSEQARDLKSAIAQTCQDTKTDPRAIDANGLRGGQNGSQTTPISENQESKQTSQPSASPTTHPDDAYAYRANQTGADIAGADMSVLEAIHPRSLIKAMKQIDPQITQLALVGAPEWLLDKITTQLPRRQARRLQRGLRTIATTKLSDMLAAQHEFTKQVLQLTVNKAR